MSLYIGETTRIYTRTLPYALIRTGIYLSAGIATLAYVALVIGLASLVSRIGGSAGGLMALIVVLAGLGGGWGLVRLAREWLLHLVKAGHVAVATAYLNHGKLPRGEGQFETGKRLVVDQFVDVNVLFAVDALVKGSVRAANRTIENLADLIPLPGMDSLAKWAGRIVDMAVQYIDETVLSHSLRKGDRNVWQSASEGVVLYAQAYRHVLRNAAVMAVIAWSASLVLTVLLGLVFWPLAAALADRHDFWKLLLVATPFVLAYFLKRGLVDPFAMISVLVTFHKHAADQPVSAEWQARIEAASEKFRDLRQKAQNFGRDRAVVSPAAPGTAAPEIRQP